MSRAVSIAFVTLVLASCATSEVELPDSYPRANAHRIEIDHTTIHYFDINPEAGGIPILYVHGYSGCAFEAVLISDEIGPEHRILALDLPGSGLSDKPDIEYTVDYFVEAVRKFAKGLGVDRFNLVGHSMGGHISSMLAVRHPELIKRLVLISPYGLEGEAGAVFTALSNSGVLVDMTFNLHTKTILNLALKHNIFYDSDKVPQDFVDYLAIATFHTDNGVGALASVTRHTVGHDPTDDLLAEIDIPTRIIWGENDRLLPFRYAERFLSLIPGSDLVPIANCGHMPQTEQQDATATAIVEFLYR